MPEKATSAQDACRFRPSSNSFAPLVPGVTRSLALSARARPSGAFPDDSSRGTAGSWFVRQLAPLVSLRRLVSARLALGALGLVTWTGWCSARPVARATGLAPLWSPLVPRWPRCVCLLHDLVPWWLVRRSHTALVSAAHSFSGRSVPRAREFHWNLAALNSSTLMAVTVLTVPRVR